MTTVYLAGPINGCTDEEAHGWRDGFMKRLPAVTFLDPMRRDFRGIEDESTDEIVWGDLDDIDACDVFLAYAWQPSWGTGMEIRYAYENGKKVVVVIPQDQRISPWLRYHAERIFWTLGEAAEHIEHSLP